MIRIQIKLPVKHNNDDIKKAVKKELQKIQKTDFDFSYIISKKSIDARDKSNIFYLYSIDVNLSDSKKEAAIIKASKGKITEATKAVYDFKPSGTKELKERPIVIGTGPAGLFCAYMLSLNGYKPLVFERGEAVDDRQQTVEHFWKTGILSTESNVQFGEGGAGTFSDGKLNTGVNDKFGRITEVLKTFVEFGAPEEITYINKPHIGTDKLREVVKGIRNKAIEYGAEFRFNSKVTDFIYDDNGLKAVVVNGSEIIPAQVAVLAIGHSARDTFRTLINKPLSLEAKSFAVGVRIEHLQETIGRGQYGEAYKDLPAADYKMTAHTNDNRGVYSFCMCPGGFVVNASSQENATVVNGMSNSGRNERNANSAIVVQVEPKDFENEGFTGVLAGLDFQEKLEKRAYSTCNGAVPVQRFEDFKQCKQTADFGNVIPNIKGQYEKGLVSDILPDYIREGIITGVEYYDRHLKGYNDPDAIISGVETRTSSPVRIKRDEFFESDIKGLYPCGEGAGYAGGITSAAVDGIKVYEAIAEKYKCLG